MIILVGIGIGIALLVAGYVQAKQTSQASTDPHASAQLTQARALKVIGWVVLGISIAIPLGLLLFWTLALESGGGF